MHYASPFSLANYCKDSVFKQSTEIPLFMIKLIEHDCNLCKFVRGKKDDLDKLINIIMA